MTRRKLMLRGLQSVLVAAAWPLVSGFRRIAKANTTERRLIGAGLQPYQRQFIDFLRTEYLTPTEPRIWYVSTDRISELMMERVARGLPMTPARDIMWRRLPFTSEPAMTIPTFEEGCYGLPPALVKPPCLSGTDVRPGSLDLVIGDCHRSSITGATVVRPVFVGKVESQDHVLFLLRQYGVRYGCVDTRPETSAAKWLQEKAENHGIEVWRAQYNPSPGGNVKMIRNEPEKLVTLERTMTLDVVHHAFQTGAGIVLPQNFKQLTNGQFKLEVGNAIRTPIKYKGRECWFWEKQGPDHALHALNLLFAAVEMSGLSGWDITDGMPEMGIVESTIEANMQGERGIFDNIERDDCVFFEA